MTRTTRARAAAASVALVAALGAAGCGGPDDEAAPRHGSRQVTPELPTALPSLPTGHGPVRPGEQVHGEGTTLVVGTRRISLAPLRVDRVAVVPGGVYFLNGGELWFTDLTRARPTAYTEVRSLVASRDGLLVGFLDLSHGPADSHGTHLAMGLGYDARTGAPLAVSYAGLGDLSANDLAAQYRTAPPVVVGISGDGLVLRGVDRREHRVRFRHVPVI